MNKNYKICVLGGGSFGTVLANLAASKGHDVSLWVKDSDKALRINSESRKARLELSRARELASCFEACSKGRFKTLAVRVAHARSPHKDYG